MSRGLNAKGTNINMMASGTFATALRGHLYNIKHIARTCIVFGGLLLPDYPKFFWFTWGTGSFTILVALGIAITRNSLRNKDSAPEEEIGIDDDDAHDGTGPDNCDENGDFEPDEVDFDSLDPDAKKAFIFSRWGHILPVTPETAEFFNVAPPGRADTRRASNMVRGEGSDGIADSVDSNVDVTRIHNTSQERVLAPRQRRGNEHLGNPDLGRMESNYIDEPRSITQAERKPDENDNTPQGRVVSPRQRRGNHNTPRERVVIPRQLYGNDHHGSASLGRIQSNYTDVPRSIAQAERKPDENENTSQERVAVSTRLYGSDRLGSPSYSRVQSNYTDEPRSITQDERKLDKDDDSKRIERSPNTPKVTTTAGLVDRNEVTRRMLYGANARDATAPTIFTTSKDCDERKPDEINDSKRIQRSPNVRKVSTTSDLVDRAGLVARTEVTRRVLHDVNAGDATAPSTTITTPTDYDERKPDNISDSKHIERSSNTPKVPTSAGLVDRTEATKRVLYDANAGDATAPSTTSTTSTDYDDKGDYAEDDELEELLGSVTKDANNASPLRIKQDGLRTRYSMRIPSPAVPNPQRTEPRDELSLRPKPLKVRRNTKDSEDPADELMSALDFFKRDEEDAAREAIERATAAEASYDDPAQNQDKTTRRSPFASFKRITSAPFSKGAKGTSKQDTEDNATSPVVSRFMPRSTSSTKPSDHESSMETDSNTQPQLSSPPSAIFRATTLNASNELEFAAVPYDQGYTLTTNNEQTPTPPPKSSRRKPLLPPLDTQNANNGAGGPSENSRAVASSRAALVSSLAEIVSEHRGTIPSGLENSITNFICGINGDENDQPSTPMPQSPSVSQGLISRRLRRRSSSENNGSGIFSPSTKIKSERVTNDSPQVKMIERRHLKENFGVESTKELVAPDEKKPSLRKRIFSRSNTNTANTAQGHVVPETSPADIPTTPVRAPTTTAGPKSPYSAPHHSLHDSLSSPTSTGRGRGYSRVSSVRTGSQPAPGSNWSTDVVSPVLSDASDSAMPSNRLKLEDEAAQKAADKKLANEDYVAYKTKKLRQATGTEIVWYVPSDHRPAHPSHGCTFFQKNLLCSTCIDNCANCGAPCCAFKGASQTAVKEKDTAEGIAAAELASSIKRWASEGRDAPTFLMCTDCGRWVCPDCIGLCPIFPCHDSICAGCNPCGLWEPCGFHTAEDAVVSEKMKRGGM